MDRKAVRVGVGVFLIRDGRVLLGERRGSHGAGTWALPGGHLEFGESIEACARREVREETGLLVSGVRQIAFSNDIFTDAGKHYVTLFVLGEGWRGEPTVKEPDKCRRWAWYHWNALPAPLFLPLRNLRRQGFVLPVGR
ncbi:MAG: NUDIX hydrolase [Desulfosarcinaceae bacterium]|nr:NUDIX hydrolase [Desulfosarcinaceae bacterium]